MLILYYCSDNLMVFISACLTLEQPEKASNYLLSPILEVKNGVAGNQDDFIMLSIVNSATEVLVYKINLEDTDYIRKDFFTVKIKDIDFDGYNDIEIFTGNGGAWKNNSST